MVIRRMEVFFLLAVFLAGCGGGGGDGGGGGLTVTTVDPPRAGIMGGGVVDISGTRFEAGAEVRFGLTASPSVSVVDSTHIQAQVPAGSTGRVDLEVRNPSGGVYRLLGGFEYLLVGTPAVDGAFSDWDSGYELAAYSGGGNTLESLSACFDSTNLYIAVREDILTGTGNSVIAWLDLSVGSGEGYTSLDSSLYDYTGSLDTLMSKVQATVTSPGFEVDGAMGSIDHAAVADSFASGAGFRGFGTEGLPGSVVDFAWIRSTVSPGSGGLEMAVPLASVFPLGISTTGQTVGLFVTATSLAGTFPALPGWTLPEQLVYASSSRTVADVVTLRVFPAGQY